MAKKVAVTLILVIIFTAGSASASEKIGISIIKALVNVPTFVEQELGLFRKSFGPGIDLVFPELASGYRQAQAMAAGEITFANCMGSTSAIVAAAGGLNLKILSIYSRAPGAFKILATSPEVRSINDLKGRTVAGPRGTVLHLLLATTLERAGISMDDVSLVEMSHDRATSALMAGKVDCALAVGPVADRAAAMGARVLTDGRGLIGGMTLVAVKGDIADRVWATSFLAAQNEAVSFIDDYPERAAEITSKATGVPAEKVLSAMKFYDFDPTIRSRDIEALRSELAFLKKQGIVKTSMDIDSMFFDSNEREVSP